LSPHPAARPRHRSASVPRNPPRKILNHIRQLAAGLALILIPAALSPNLLVLALLIGLAGVLVSPALATAYVLADSLAAATARNRAGNWVNSGYNAGTSAGAALSGQMVGRIPLSACLPVLAAPALLAIVPLLRSRLTPAAGQQPAPGGPPDDTASPGAGERPSLKILNLS
jgi:predicted MFS family arabinose efflux permease